MDQMRAQMNRLFHEQAGLPTEEDFANNENLARSRTNIPAENSDGGNSPVTQPENTVSRGDGSDTDSQYAEASANSQVDSQNMEESIFLPITCTPVFMILSLFYNFHKMGILYPLLYSISNYYSALYSCFFEEKQK
jgi:hypothetical protein